MTAILSIQNLSRAFGGVQALDNVTLDLQKGEVHAIIGPNGAGKTTLISHLAGSQFPDHGTITLNGRTITRTPAHKRARLGLTRSFQITSLVMDMTVADNIALAAAAREGHAFRFLRPAHKITTIRDASLAALSQVGLTHRADMLTSALSHGEHRLMELALALASGADVMLLDEPMAGLGQDGTAQMIALLQALKGQKSILLIEHDMDAVFALADRISVLVYGQIIATGSPAEIRANPDVRRAYLGEDT